MPVAYGAGLRGEVECEANRVPKDESSYAKASQMPTAEGKLQFKAPFVENLFSQRGSRDGSRPNSNDRHISDSKSYEGIPS